MTLGEYFVMFVPMLITLYSFRVLALPHHRPALVLSTTSQRYTPYSPLDAINPTHYLPTTKIQYSEPWTKGVDCLVSSYQGSFSGRPVIRSTGMNTD